MASDTECNRCGKRSMLAQEWGVCASCFDDDCEALVERVLSDTGGDADGE